MYQRSLSPSLPSPATKAPVVLTSLQYTYILLLLTLFYDKRGLDIRLHIGYGLILLLFNSANNMIVIIFICYSNISFFIYFSFIPPILICNQRHNRKKKHVVGASLFLILSVYYRGLKAYLCSYLQKHIHESMFFYETQNVLYIFFFY